MGIEHEFLCAVCHDVVNVFTSDIFLSHYCSCLVTESSYVFVQSELGFEDPVTLHCSHHLCAVDPVETQRQNLSGSVHEADSESPLTSRQRM